MYCPKCKRVTGPGGVGNNNRHKLCGRCKPKFGAKARRGRVLAGVLANMRRAA